MRRQMWFWAVAAAGVVSLAAPAYSEVTSFGGSVTARIVGLRGGQIDSEEVAEDTIVDPNQNLPLQVVVRRVDPTPPAPTDAEAAGVVGAQLADPRTATTGDPDEFAIDLALSSLSPTVRYVARASSEEVRRIRYNVGELGTQPAGTTVRLRGRLFVDGVLAVFANNNVADLSGAYVRLRVTVAKEVDGQAPQEVFAGTLALTGGTDRTVTPATTGGFPRVGVLSADLSAVDSELGVFRVLVFPNLTVDYPYDAVVNEDFALRATVTVEAENIPGGVGVAAVIGTPFEALAQVVASTRGNDAAAKMTTALSQERRQPTGKPAFADDNPLAGFLRFFPLCGLFGVESVLGALALVGLRIWNPYRRPAGVR